MSFEYECAVSGVTSPSVEESESDGMEDAPVGWTRIRITRRQYNPKWLALQQLKERILTGTLLQQTGGNLEAVTPELREMTELQVEANFYGFEKDIPMYILDVDDAVFVSDSGEVLKSLNEIRENLGLEAMTLPNYEEDEEDEASP